MLNDLVAKGALQRSGTVAPRKINGLLGGLFKEEGEEVEGVLEEIVTTYHPSPSFWYLV